MIEIFRRKLAETLNDTAHKGLAQLDKDSPLAQELRKHDVESILKADIEKICNNVSFLEMTRFIALISQLNSSNKNIEGVKKELKKMAQRIIDRTQLNSGKLGMPPVCQEILFNL